MLHSSMKSHGEPTCFDAEENDFFASHAGSVDDCTFEFFDSTSFDPEILLVHLCGQQVL